MKQQEQVHIQAQAHEHERKDAMNTRVINDTTLRIYFPRIPEVTATIPSVSASSLLHLSVSTSDSHDKDKDFKNNQAPPLLLNTPSPS